MSPEVITGDRYTEGCDVYSFAFVLYEIASRSLPFIMTAAGNPAPISSIPFLVAQKRLRPPMPDDKPHEFPENLCKIIKMAWAQDRRERPSMSDLVAMLQKWRENEICSLA